MTEKSARAAAHVHEVAERGMALLNHSLHNKGTAFTAEERSRFGLEGLLPPKVTTIEEQVDRARESIARKGEPLEKYIGLVALQDRNETLFYRLLLEEIESLLPIVYTPTVGLATQRFSQIFRQSRGVWISLEHRGRVREVLSNVPLKDVRLLVVTDGERILGLGDQGAGGMGISIGKLALYTVGAGIEPKHTLPVCLDVGTDNEELLADSNYLGLRQARCRGPEYDALVDEFVEAVRELFPNALLQWEDFKKVNAMNLLERYRSRLLSFNDDIQGTAAVALAGVLAGVRATGVDLVEHRVVILGAGAAGIGIAGQVHAAFRRVGLTEAEAYHRIAVLDSRGLLVAGRSYRDGEDYKDEYSWSADHAESLGLVAGEGNDLAAVVEAFKPTVLVGTSGQPGAFTEAIVRSMASHVDAPLIFPFSNPTSKSEAQPADVIAWTDGRAWVATGSPFDDVEHGGQTFRIGQGNNVYIFPGVGLGALAAEATEVTEGMFTVAAKTLAEQISDDELATRSLYPRLPRLRDISRAIALAVAEEAVRAGAAPERNAEDLQSRIDSMMWFPDYPELLAV